MKAKRIHLAVAALLCVSDWVLAEGWYASVYGGHAFSETELERSHASPADELAFEVDLHVGAKLGYTFPERELGNWRAELDLTHVSGKLRSNWNAVHSEASTNAEVDAYFFMARGLYDFTLAPESRWRPYVGVGAGFISVDVDSQAFAAEPLLRRDKTRFAAEISGGVSYMLNEKIDLFVDMKHRFID